MFHLGGKPYTDHRGLIYSGHEQVVLHVVGLRVAALKLLSHPGGSMQELTGLRQRSFALEAGKV